MKKLTWGKNIIYYDVADAGDIYFYTNWSGFYEWIAYIWVDALEFRTNEDRKWQLFNLVILEDVLKIIHELSMGRMQITEEGELVTTGC